VLRTSHQRYYNDPFVTTTSEAESAVLFLFFSGKKAMMTSVEPHSLTKNTHMPIREHTTMNPCTSMRAAEAELA
jgi:hypothetical protein